MAHLDAAQQRLRAFIFHELHSPCPVAAGSDVLATCMGDASVIGRIHQLGSVECQQTPQRAIGSQQLPILPPACADLLAILRGPNKTRTKREAPSHVAAAYFSATQECRQLIYNLPALPTLGSSPRHVPRGPRPARRRASHPRVASLAGAHGFDSRHTLQTAIGLAAAGWDTFIQLMEQSGDVVGVVQAFVSSFQQLSFRQLCQEEHDEILDTDIEEETLQALEGLRDAYVAQHPLPPVQPATSVQEATPPSRRVHRLLHRLRKWLRDHPAWKAVAKEQVASYPAAAMSGLSGTAPAHVQLTWAEVDDCLERFVTGKLHSMIANPRAYPGGIILNNYLELRCLALRHLVTWDRLDCKQPPIANGLSWQLAIAWLQAVPRFAAPCDKLTCMLNSCSVVSKLLSHVYDSSSGSISQAEGAQVGADDFLPCLIFVILQAAVPTMFSDLQYVQAYRDESQLLSENGYYFTNITSACNFVASATPAQLRLTDEQVTAATRQAIKTMQAAAAERQQAGAQGGECSQSAAWELQLIHDATSDLATNATSSAALTALCDEHKALCKAMEHSDIPDGVYFSLGLKPPKDDKAGAHDDVDEQLIMSALMGQDSSPGASSSDESEDTPLAASSGAASSPVGSLSLRQEALDKAAHALRVLPEMRLVGRSGRRVEKLRESVGNWAPEGVLESQLAKLRGVLIDAQIIGAL